MMGPTTEANATLATRARRVIIKQLFMRSDSDSDVPG